MAYPNLYAEMARKGLTPKDIAANLQRDVSTVYNWLSGDSEPRMSDAVKIADLLGVDSIRYLFSEQETVTN